MFSKSKINEPGQKDSDAATPSAPAPTAYAADQIETKPSAPKAKPPASVLSSDLHVTGNMKTTGDIQVEGTVAHFEGSVQRQDDPLTKTAAAKPAAAAPAPRQTAAKV